jgi:hypothetical protein
MGATGHTRLPRAVRLLHQASDDGGPGRCRQLEDRSAARHATKAASEDWGHSPCRRQPASTQTRHNSQHHSEDYCEREVDDLELQGGRVYLHFGARRDDPPQGQVAGPMPEAESAAVTCSWSAAWR